MRNQNGQNPKSIQAATHLLWVAHDLERIADRATNIAERVIFVVTATGINLDDDLRARIRADVRTGASPRHVPSIILEVPELPRTRSGKLVELAVRNVVEGRPVTNSEALANPAALDHFRNLPELAV